MDFAIPTEIQEYLAELDAFIERAMKPLEAENPGSTANSRASRPSSGTTAVRDGGDWVLNGGKRFNTDLHRATTDLLFARTSGRPGDARGIAAFLVPTDPFEHIYRHHRRYRITEGSEEIRIRNVAGHMFGFLDGGRRPA